MSSTWDDFITGLDYLSEKKTYKCAFLGCETRIQNLNLSAKTRSCESFVGNLPFIVNNDSSESQVYGWRSGIVVQDFRTQYPSSAPEVREVRTYKVRKNFWRKEMNKDKEIECKFKYNLHA